MEDALKIEDGSAVLKINPKIYAMETVYSAAYVFLDRAYVLLDGDPEKEILVSLKPKEKQDMEKLGREFLNELVNYADYRKRAEQTRKIRETLLQRALITNDPPALQDNEEFEDITEDLDDEDYLEDPEGIAIPWEEKYGKNEGKDKTEQ